MNCVRVAFLALIGIFLCCAASAKEEVVFAFTPGIPPVEFAAKEIRQALEARGDTVLFTSLQKLGQTTGRVRVVLLSSAEEARQFSAATGLGVAGSSGPQSYRIGKKEIGGRITCVVSGADALGAMYGGLDVAEAARYGTLTELKEGEHKPYIERRGIKFNIPLDARTPSYSDAGDSAQQNIPEMWNLEFWQTFLDEMAQDRYNVLSLWNLHPFPSMVKVPGYPDVALADVMRTTVKFDTTYSTAGRDMVRPEHLANLETVKKLSMEEKIRFWREVMQYAHDRGIEVYLFTWNIFTWGAEGKYGITSAQTNQITIEYFRQSVREMLLTYPLLAGFGVTAGEHMDSLKGEFSKEKWLWKTYGQGICDVKKLQPKRSIRLIHRYHQTSGKEILKEWKEYPDTFEFSYKYSVAHMYSTPAPIFFRQEVELPPGLRTWMTVRNDDIYSFRWGDPEYARAYIRALPSPKQLAGYYMGPDGYIWGREFISTEPETPRQLVIQQQWYSFMLWGRLSYEPELPDALFERALAQRFAEASSAKLFQAFGAASKIIPQITRFFWGDIDLKWFPEACVRRPAGEKGFYSVEHFMNGETMPGCGILNIRTYCEKVLKNKATNGITPLEVAEALKAHAQVTLQLLSELRAGTNKELRLTLGDLRAMAHLGNYYAEKILGATDLALFGNTGKPEEKASAVRHLEAALEHWKDYARVATRQYRPQLLTRIGYVDLNALTDCVQKDVAIARSWKGKEIPSP